MLFTGKLFGLLSGDFSSAAICFVSKKTNLDINISFLSKVFKPISNMIESGSSRNIKNNKCSIYIPIVTLSTKILPHSQRTISLLSSSIPNLHFSFMSTVQIDNFGWEFNSDGWYNIIRWSVSTESIDNICFACGCISNKDYYN